jgi:ribosomal-protein-alanine N-acetyltransferase
VNPVFEKLAAGHLREVLEIENASFPKPWSRALFEREINFPLSNFYVASIDGKLAAYGGFWHVIEEAHVVSLAVHPAYRRQGLAKAFLQFLIENMKALKITKILLEVRHGNISALRLYESFGFTVTGNRPQYYGNEDAVLMEKAL